MKRLLPVLFLVAVCSNLYAGELREYRFSTDVAPTASPPYIGAVVYDALLYDGFTADNAVLGQGRPGDDQAGLGGV